MLFLTASLEVSTVAVSLGIVGVVLYTLLGVIVLVTWLVRRLCLKPKNDKIGTLAGTVRGVFRVFLMLFIAARIGWFVVRTWRGDDIISFCLNRFCLLFFWTAFSLILFFWAEQFHKRYYESTAFLPKVGFGFIILNLIIYVFQIVILVLYILSDQRREGNPLYEINITASLCFFAVVSIGFLVYGCLLFHRQRNMDKSVSGRNKELIKITIITLVFTFTFMLRVFMLSFRQITGYYMDEVYFILFGYIVPELIPSLLQVYISETSEGKQEQDIAHIEKLYQQSEEDIQDFKNFNNVKPKVYMDPSFESTIRLLQSSEEN